MKCKKHPQYKAMRKPRVNCPECWNMYNNNGKPKPPPLRILDEADRLVGYKFEDGTITDISGNKKQ